MPKTTNTVVEVCLADNDDVAQTPATDFTLVLQDEELREDPNATHITTAMGKHEGTRAWGGTLADLERRSM